MVALAFQARAEQECAALAQAVYRTWLELAARAARKRKLRVRYVTFIVKIHFYAAETRSTGKQGIDNGLLRARNRQFAFSRRS